MYIFSSWSLESILGVYNFNRFISISYIINLNLFIYSVRVINQLSDIGYIKLANAIKSRGHIIKQNCTQTAEIPDRVQKSNIIFMFLQLGTTNFHIF